MATRIFQSCSRLHPCPICGNTTGKKCRVKIAPEFDGKRICICGKHQSDRTSSDGYWVHYINDTGDLVSPSSGAIVAPDIRHKIYSTIINDLPLEKWHHRILSINRGYSDNEIRRHGFKTWAQKYLTPIKKKLNEMFSVSELSGIPGLYTKNENLQIVSRYPGIVIPLRDERGRIIALKIEANINQRYNQSGIKKKGKKQGSKYLLLSSSGYSNGASPGAVLSVEYPGGINKGGRIWVTEGEHKAKIAASILDETVISIGGSGQAISSGLIPTLKSIGCKSIVLAFDADKRENLHVRNAEKQAVRALLNAGISVDIAEWNPVSGNGLDDMLINRRQRFDEITQSEKIVGEGMEVSIPSPIEIKYCHRQEIDYCKRGDTVRVPPERIPAEMPAYYSVPEAAKHHYKEIFKILSTPNSKPGAYLFSGSPGSAKSTSSVKALSDLIWPKSTYTGENGKDIQKPEKMLFLAGTKDLAKANGIDTIRGATPLEGRSSDPTSQFYCLNCLEADRCGEKRHNIVRNVCRPTKNGEYLCYALQKKRKESGDSNYLCPFIKTSKKAAKARITYSTKHKILVGGKAFHEADKMIVDEDPIPFLVDQVTITRGNIDEWRDNINQNQNGNIDSGLFKDFLIILQEAFTYERKSGEYERPLLPEMIRAAEPNGYTADRFRDLIRTVASIPTYPPDMVGAPYWFEKPFHAPGGWVFPLRAVEDLVTLLRQEIDSPGGGHNVWLSSPCGQPKITMHFVKWDIVHQLRQKVVIFLDATASPFLKKLFPNLIDIPCQLKTHIHVTQFTDYQFTQKSLRGYLRKRVQDDIIGRIERNGFKAPVVISFKQFNPNEGGKLTFDFPPHLNVKVGHFGKDDRGENKYKDADSIFLVGTYTPNLSALKMQTHAIRRYCGDRSAIQEGEKLEIIPYHYHHTNDGDMPKTGKVVYSQLDPLHDTVIKHAQESTAIQAAFRGRPGHKTADNPLKIVMYSDIPTSIRVDVLTTLGDSTAEIALKNYHAQRTNYTRNKVVQIAFKIMGEKNPPLTVTDLADRICKKIEMNNNLDLKIKRPNLYQWGINAAWMKEIVQYYTTQSKTKHDTKERFFGSNPGWESNTEKCASVQSSGYIYIKGTVVQLHNSCKPSPTEAMQKQTLDQTKNATSETFEEERIFRDELAGIENCKVVHGYTSNNRLNINTWDALNKSILDDLVDEFDLKVGYCATETEIMLSLADKLDLPNEWA